jgi:ABC-type transporter Mla subunit MlaD
MVMAFGGIDLQPRYRITVYVADAGGLRADSPVTLSGIPVGEVEVVRQEPGTNGRVQVICTIRSDQLLPGDARAQVATSGIFGDASIAITSVGNPERRTLPIDGSANLTASAGFFAEAGDKAKGLIAAAEALLSPEMRAEALRFLTNAADLAADARAVAQALKGQQEEIGATLRAVRTLADELRERSVAVGARIDGAGTALEQLAQRIAGASDRYAAAAEKADALLTRTDRLVGDNAEALGTLLHEAAGLAASTARLFRTAETGGGVLSRLLTDRRLADDLDRIAIDAAAAAKVIADDPSTLVFGAGEAGEAAKAERTRERTRRRIDEDLGVPTPASATPAAPAATP